MKITLYLALLAPAAAALCLASSHSDRWPVREQETIQKTLTLSGPPMRLMVDNVDGYVHVTGTGGSQVRVTAHKVIRAETDSDLQEAKNEVNLQMTEKPGTVSIYYDAPWRCNGEGRGCHDQQRRFYNVSYDIDVEVPRDARIVVSTVNNGDIRVNGTAGDFEINNINGGIAMTSIAGAGDVHTINGPVTVHFVKNPSGPTSFKSINGQLDAYFQPGLSADLSFKTFNGQIYSDFEVVPRAAAAAETEEQNGRFVYHSDRARSARVGSGGPKLSFDAFNGNIRLHREQ
ncbi:MAG: hypothetical protein JO033_01310 [Acidobacteriaceae bacterium]|nr:hypothetical protein [Acidobacteriaceae bacterium]